MGRVRNTGSNHMQVQNAARTMMANIMFSSVDEHIRTIVVTSSVPTEGKSTCSIELAEAFASSGKRTLLIDCDLRRRSLSQIMGIRARYGLYAVLSGQTALSIATVQTSVENLEFLDAEPHTANPQAILSSKRFERFIDSIKKSYDIVIFDTPPIGAFVDAAIVSALADGTVMVVREGLTKREEMVATYNQLKTAGANVLGVCLNGCQTKGSEYYDYYTSKDKGNKKGSKKFMDTESSTGGFSSVEATPVETTSIVPALPEKKRHAR